MQRSKSVAWQASLSHYQLFFTLLPSILFKKMSRQYNTLCWFYFFTEQRRPLMWIGLSKGFLIPIRFWKRLEMLRLCVTKTAVDLENTSNFSLIGEKLTLFFPLSQDSIGNSGSCCRSIDYEHGQARKRASKSLRVSRSRKSTRRL